MTIAEFRDLTAALSESMVSARSAATPHERRLETDRVERCCVALERAFCPTACRPGNHDGIKASAMILTARKLIRDNQAAFPNGDNMSDLRRVRVQHEKEWQFGQRQVDVWRIYADQPGPFMCWCECTSRDCANAIADALNSRPSVAAERDCGDVKFCFCGSVATEMFGPQPMCSGCYEHRDDFADYAG